MTPTNKLRFVKRTVNVTYQGYIDINELKKVKILQQWWEGFGPNVAINYAHPDAYKLSKNPPGEWRDVPIEEQA